MGPGRRGRGTLLLALGNNGEFKCFAVAYPESGAGVVVLTNGWYGLRLCRSILPPVTGGEHGVFRSGLLDG